MKRWIVGLVVVVLAACGASATETDTQSDTTVSACEEAFSEAAAVDEMQDLIEDLFPAVHACSTLDEWAAASDAYPDALDGANPELFLTNICANYSEIADAELCRQTG